MQSANAATDKHKHTDWECGRIQREKKGKRSMRRICLFQCLSFWSSSSVPAAMQSFRTVEEEAERRIVCLLIDSLPCSETLQKFSRRGSLWWSQSWGSAVVQCTLEWSICWAAVSLAEKAIIDESEPFGSAIFLSRSIAGAAESSPRVIITFLSQPESETHRIVRACRGARERQQSAECHQRERECNGHRTVRAQGPGRILFRRWAWWCWSWAPAATKIELEETETDSRHWGWVLFGTHTGTDWRWNGNNEETV